MTDRVQLCDHVRQLKTDLVAAETLLENTYWPLVSERLAAGDDDGARALIEELPDGSLTKIILSGLMRDQKGRGQ